MPTGCVISVVNHPQQAFPAKGHTGQTPAIWRHKHCAARFAPEDFIQHQPQVRQIQTLHWDRICNGHVCCFVRLWWICERNLVGKPAITRSHPYMFSFSYCHKLQPRCPKPDGRVKSKAASSRHKSIEVPRRPTLAQAMTANMPVGENLIWDIKILR